MAREATSVAMENEGTPGRHVVAPAQRVIFITRPYTSPKENATRSPTDVSTVQRSAMTSKRHSDPRKIRNGGRELGRISKTGGRMATATGDSGAASAPKIRIWRCSDAEQSPAEASKTASQQRSSSEDVPGSSGASIPNSANLVSDDSGTMIKSPSKLVSRQGSKPGYPERKKHHHIQRDLRRQESELPRHRLARILKGLRIIIGFCLAIKRCAQKHTETSISSMLSKIDDSFSDSSVLGMINFDLDKLKESGVTRPVKHLGHRLRSILYIPPEKRSTEDVRKIFVFLRMLPTFRNWAVVILLNFCRYAVYQKYQPKQVIIKRGHYPEGYYIILSGKVLVSEWSAATGADTNRSTYELSCGDIFGEKELVDNVPRQSTVICRTECELLTATREDYLEVVSRPMQKIMDENIEFLRSLRLFEHFPCHKLSDPMAEYSVKLYSKDTVVVPASDSMMNLIIIKKGKCKVTGEITEEQKTLTNSPLDLELRAIFPKEYEKRHRPELQRAPTSLELEWQTGEMRGVMKANLLMGIRDPERLVVSAGQKNVRERTTVTDSWSPSGYGLNRLYEKMETTRPKLQRNQTDSNGDTRTDSSEESTTNERLDSGNRFSSRGRRRKTKRPSRKQATPTPLEAKGHQCISNESDEKKYVVLDTLGPGSIFGLEAIFFQYPLRLSLVSEGAECISISKTFFVKECNLEVLNAATDVVIRYPSMTYIRKQVDEKKRWERYKKQVVHQVIQPRLLSREPTRLCLA